MTAKNTWTLQASAALLRYVYRIALYLLLPFILVRLCRRAQQSPGYGKYWWQRFGLVPKQHQPKTLWLHAASVGEVAAAVPLVQTLKKHYPNYQLIVTTATATGAQRLRQLLADQVQHYYVPYDFASAVKRFLQRVQPSLLIIMETELWPNLLYYAKQQQIPILLANARLSAKSAKGYRWLKPLMQQMLNSITLIAAQTAADAARFIDLGANPEHVKIWGNIKYEISLPADLLLRAAALRQQLGTERPVWIAASTHAGEEEIILAAQQQILQVLPNCLLILVPRHPERFAPVANLCQQQGFTVAKRSQGNANNRCQLFLGDTLGELMLFYAASDVALVGGSLVPLGGHNFLEPAAVGVPILSGPHVVNFAAIAELFFSSHAAIKVTNAVELTQKIVELLQNKPQRQQLAQQASLIIQQNQGVLEKYNAWLTATLPLSEDS